MKNALPRCEHVIGIEMVLRVHQEIPFGLEVLLPIDGGEIGDGARDVASSSKSGRLIIEPAILGQHGLDLDRVRGRKPQQTKMKRRRLMGNTKQTLPSKSGIERVKKGWRVHAGRQHAKLFRRQRGDQSADEIRSFGSRYIKRLTQGCAVLQRPMDLRSPTMGSVRNAKSL